MKLRSLFHSKIDQMINNTNFSQEEFDIALLDDDDDSPLIQITYLSNTSFTLLVYRSSGKYRVIMSPGETYESEIVVILGLQDYLPKAIKTWAKYISEEIENQARINIIDNIKKIIEEGLVSDLSDDEVFSEDEVDRLTSKFNELEARVKKLEEEEIISETENIEFNRQVEIIKSNILTMPKRLWLENTKNKLANAFSMLMKSKEAKKIIFDGIRKLMSLD